MKHWIIPILIVLLTACENGRCLKSIGSQTSETRSVDTFHSIDIVDNLNLRLTSDSVFSVRVEGGSNLIPFVETVVKDGWLHIADRNLCDWARSYDHEITVVVSAPNLKHLTCSNSGNITCDDTLRTTSFLFEQWAASGENELLLEADTVSLKLHTGTGDLRCAGRANNVFVFAASYGYVYCEKLITANAWTALENSGDVHIYSSNRLRAYLHTDADVYLYGGAADLLVEGEGSGKIIRQ